MTQGYTHNGVTIQSEGYVSPEFTFNSYGTMVTQLVSGASTALDTQSFNALADAEDRLRVSARQDAYESAQSNLEENALSMDSDLSTLMADIERRVTVISENYIDQRRIDQDAAIQETLSRYQSAEGVPFSTLAQADQTRLLSFLQTGLSEISLESDRRSAAESVFYAALSGTSSLEGRLASTEALPNGFDIQTSSITYNEAADRYERTEWTPLGYDLSVEGLSESISHANFKQMHREFSSERGRNERVQLGIKCRFRRTCS